MKISLVLIISLVYSSVIAQTDTIYGSHNPWDINEGTVARKVLEVDGSYYVWVQNVTSDGNYLSVHKADSFFNEEQRKIIAIEENLEIDRVFHVHSNEEEIICLVSTSDGISRNLISVAISFDLSEVDIKSEIALDDTIEDVSFFQFRYNDSEEVYYSIGTINNGEVLENVLLEIPVSGENLRLETVAIESPKLNLATTKIEDHYFTSSFGSNTSCLINESLSLLTTQRNFLTFEEENVTYNGDAVLHDCFENNGAIDCVGRTIPITTHGLLLMSFELVDQDSFALSNFVPLLSTPARLSAAKTIADEDFYYSVGTGVNLFNSTVDPNILHISKVDKNNPHDIQWTVLFETGEEFLASDVVIDKQGSLLIVGSTLGNDNISGRKNFYLKIFQDGTIVDAKDLEQDYQMKIFPNPNQGDFFLGLNCKYSIDIQIYDVFGRLVFDMKSVEYLQEVKTGLQSGAYFVLLKERSRERMLKMIVR